MEIKKMNTTHEAMFEFMNLCRAQERAYNNARRIDGFVIQIDELRIELDDFESEQNQVFIRFKDAMQILSDDYTKTGD